MTRRIASTLFRSGGAALLFASVSAHAIDPRAVTGAQSTPSVPAAVSAVSDNGTARSGGGFLSGIFGCPADGDKQKIGAIAGGVLGGVLGNRIGGRGSRTLGTLLGGAMGAAAGSWLGCKLQRSDQEKAERALENAVVSGENQSWTSPETGASGSVTPVSAPGLSDLRFADGVEPADGYAKIGGAFVSTGTVNVRSMPSTQGRVLGQLAPGQRIWVPAAVQGQPWVLISDNGVAQGYVSRSLLRQESTATASNCKLVKQTISVPGAADETETLQACKDASGQWVMTRV